MPTVAEIQAALIFGLTAAAMISDLRFRRIPNGLTVSAFIGALVFHGATAGWAGLGQALLGFGTGFGLIFLLWLIGGSGGGDVKLMGAVGAWLGPKLTFWVLAVSAVLVSVIGLGILIVAMAVRGPTKFREQHLSVETKTKKPKKGQTENQRRSERRLMPFALPVALGTWMILGWQLLAAR